MGFFIATLGMCIQVLFKVTSIIIAAKLPTRDISNDEENKSCPRCVAERPRPCLALDGTAAGLSRQRVPT